MTGSHISLFTGVGMLDLAAERLGFPTIVTAEILPFCNEVLRVRFPSAKRFIDVRHVRAGVTENQVRSSYFHMVDATAIPRPLLMTGGFPCQGASSSGNAQGMRDPRTGLWRDFARLIREFKPEFVMIENSARLLSRGMDRVLHDLCGLGYDAQWDCIPAASVGAPHLRDRVWIGAVPMKFRSHPPVHLTESWSGGRLYARFERAGRMIDGAIYRWTPAATIKACRENAKRRGVRLLPTPTRSDGTGGPGTTPRREGGKNLRTVAYDRCGHGRLNPAFLEWMMGLPQGWTDPIYPNSALRPFIGWDVPDWKLPTMVTAPRVPNRGDRIRALGNGCVPQIAHVALTDLFDWAEGRA